MLKKLCLALPLKPTPVLPTHSQPLFSGAKTQIILSAPQAQSIHAANALPFLLMQNAYSILRTQLQIDSSAQPSRPPYPPEGRALLPPPTRAVSPPRLHADRRRSSESPQLPAGAGGGVGGGDGGRWGVDVTFRPAPPRATRAPRDAAPPRAPGRALLRPRGRRFRLPPWQVSPCSALPQPPCA